MKTKVRTDGGTQAMLEVLRNAPELMQSLSSAMGEEALGLLREGFRNETDPYGQRWQEKQQDDGRKVLHGESSNLRLGWKTLKVASNKVKLAPSVWYAAVHQDGVDKVVSRAGSSYRLKIPARRMIPTSSRGIPASWRQALSEAAEEAIQMYQAKLTSGGGKSLRDIASMVGLRSSSLNILAIIRRAFEASQ